jgi:MYXO-CTERM domain-containing protein
VAWGGGSYLVAWPDARRVSVAPAAIFAARVSPAGVVLDPGGIELTPVFDAAALSDQIAPAVAWNGSVWMVVWNARNDQPSLIGARVSPQGEALDPGGIPVVPGYGSSRAAIASDGDGFLVAYTQFDGAGFVRLSAGGTPVDPAPTAFPLPANVQGVTPPAVAYNGTSYLVAYTYGSTTGAAFVARRVSPAGVILDPADIVVANEGVPPAMASDGSDWLLAWRSPSTGAIRGQRIQADGTVLDGPSGAVIADPGDAVPSQTVSVVRGAGEYAVLWLGPQQLYGARVSSAGAVVAVTGDVLADGVYRSQLAAAGDGSSYYAVYLEDVVRGGRLGPTLAKLDPSSVLIAAAANAQRYPASAYNGTSWLVVWEDGRDGQPRTYGTRVSPAGLVLDPAGIPIGPAFSALPSVGSNGTDWLVTWYGAPGSGCARVSAAGSVVDPGGITISLAGGYSGTAVASDGVDYLVAWDEPGTRIARVTAAGAVLDPGGVTLSTGTYWGAPKPAVAYGGADYLVSWRAATSPFPVLARRVTTGAVVLDPGAAAITIAAKGYDVALASSGDGWLVTWADSPRIFARRVDAGGALLDAAPILVAQGPGGRSWPTAAWDGTQYWLAWMAGDVQVDVYAARMTAAGSVLDAGGATGGSGGTGAGGGGASSSSTGTSGAGAGSSGAGGAGGAEEPPVILQPGCGCRVGDDGSPGGRAVAGLLALLVLRRRRAGPRR